MEKKVTKNYIALSKKTTIGSKKRDIIVKPIAKTTKSPTNVIKRTRNCSGCSRKRKSG